MKPRKRAVALLALLLLVSGGIIIAAFSFRSHPAPLTSNTATKPATDTPVAEKGCVFKTVFGEEASDSDFIYKTPQKVAASQQKALVWMAAAQAPDGGWGAGSHSHQGVRDPHAVKSDPATTAMVAMALLRCQNTPISGPYKNNLNKGMEYLIAAVENTPDGNDNITTQTGTQPQVKLGSNIDVVLTSQFFTNVMDYLHHDPKLKQRVEKCLNKCVAKIQKSQDSDGSFRGAGWAGVLQSSLANNALETAKTKGAKVDTVVLENSRKFQKGNVDAKTGDVKTEKGAGIVLYSVSSASRASAKESRVAKEVIAKAKQEGKLTLSDKVSVDNLKKSGLSDEEAMKYNAAYEVNESAKNSSMRADVMDGFGSNGGEEFLSYLQTGEGMIMSKDREWKKWYDNVNGRLLKIQNIDGSWSGHHCITSPVFCTATCLLILSVNNDIEGLVAMGSNEK